MTISKTSLWSKFYCLFYSVYKDNQPDNFCNWFWLIILGFISLPFTWITLFFKGFVNVNNPLEVFRSRLISGLLVLILPYLYTVLLLLNWKKTLLGTCMMLGFIACIATLVGLFWVSETYIIPFIKNLLNKNKEKNLNKPKTDNVLIGAFKAFKGKYCPKIDWIN